MKIKLVATDLDGTLLRNDKSISAEDIEMLRRLGEKQISRIVATGRNFKKVKEVLNDHAPVDYVAFSSGAGIYDWQNKQLMYSRNMNRQTVNDMAALFADKGYNFLLFREVPDNFRSWYHRGRKECDEFERCLQYHGEFSEKLPNGGNIPLGACQFVVIFKNHSHFLELQQELEERFDNVKIIRSTSPLRTEYIWMEVFDRDVSKGNAVRFLCEHLDIPREFTFSIGNDYNDLDMLDFTLHSYVVDNGPQKMRSIYLPAPSNEENGFSRSVKWHL